MDCPYKLNVPTKSGYEFLGWFDAEEGGTQYADSFGVCLSVWATGSNVALYAQWRLLEFSIDYEEDPYLNLDGLPKQYSVEDAAVKLPIIERDYWYTSWELNGQTITSINTKLASNILIRVIWKWLACPITLEKNNAAAGSVGDVSGAIAIGDSATITATTNTGYTWVGWFDGETKVSDGASLSYTFIMPAENKTYTAKWIEVTLCKNVAGAGGTSALGEKYSVGDNVTITATTNAGYTWVGWFDGETKVSEGTSLSYTFTMPAENKTYTAKWIKITLKKSSDVAGSISSLGGKYFVGDSVTITASTNTGYTWLGWYWGDTLICDKSEFVFTMPDESREYIAKWTYYTLTVNNTVGGTYVSNLMPCVVKFDSNGGTAINDQVITETTGLVYPNIPRKNGCAFKGWYRDAACTELYDFASAVTKDITLYAGWATAKGSYISTKGFYNSHDSFSFTTYGTSYSAPKQVCFTALTSRGYGLYYTTTQSGYSAAATVFNVYNLTKGIKIKTEYFDIRYSMDGCFNRLGFTADAGDIICLEVYIDYSLQSYDYTNFKFYIEGGEYPPAGGKKAGMGGMAITNEKIAANTEITLFATTDEGYRFVGWFDGEERICSDESYTFNMPEQSITYTAKWEVSEECCI